MSITIVNFDYGHQAFFAASLDTTEEQFMETVLPLIGKNWTPEEFKRNCYGGMPVEKKYWSYKELRGQQFVQVVIDGEESSRKDHWDILIAVNKIKDSFTTPSIFAQDAPASAFH